MIPSFMRAGDGSFEHQADVNLQSEHDLRGTERFDEQGWIMDVFFMKRACRTDHALAEPRSLMWSGVLKCS